MNTPTPEQVEHALLSPDVLSNSHILAAEVRRLRVIEAEATGLSTALQVANQRAEAAEARAREWANVAGLNGADKDAALLAGHHWKKRAEAAEARRGATPKSK